MAMTKKTKTWLTLGGAAALVFWMTKRQKAKKALEAAAAAPAPKAQGDYIAVGEYIDLSGW